MAEVINVYSAKGGAGATTCAVKLGLALAAEGERTLVIDGDSVCGSGLEACGLQGLNVYTLADVETGACRVKQAILQHPASPNLYVLPSLGCQSAETVKRAVDECRALFDFIVCDGGAILDGILKSGLSAPADGGFTNDGTTAWAAGCRALLISDPYHTSIVAARKRGGELSDCGFKQVGLIVNKVNGGLVFDGEILTPQEFASVVRLPLWGVIPEDLSLPLGKMRADTKKAFSMTAEHILGKSQRVFGVVKPFIGVRGMIRRKLRARV